MKKGKLLVISGPSAGAGKDTLLKMFLDKHPDWYQPPSTTTRLPREGEVADKDMKFVSVDQFRDWEKENKFLETDFHAGNWYGTLHQPIETLMGEGKNVVLRIDVNGALQIKNKLPDANLVFIGVENINVLEARIRDRGSESEEQIKQRLDLAKNELKVSDKFDHVVINKNGKQQEALEVLEKISGTLDS